LGAPLLVGWMDGSSGKARNRWPLGIRERESSSVRFANAHSCMKPHEWGTRFFVAGLLKRTGSSSLDDPVLRVVAPRLAGSACAPGRLRSADLYRSGRSWLAPKRRRMACLSGGELGDLHAGELEDGMEAEGVELGRKRAKRTWHGIPRNQFEERWLVIGPESGRATSVQRNL
jgi:hypothetical protein